jgi:hypothetical protein
MTAAAMLEIQVHAIKWQLTSDFECKLIHRLRKKMLSSKVIKAAAYGKKTAKINCKK